MNNCFKCDISTNRKNIVWGHGKKPSKLMFIGEAPGYYEDKYGVPFVGASGLVLSNLIELINLDRKEVYITNIIRCRPPHNRNPLRKEIMNCLPFLVKELSEVNPKIIITLGQVATTFFSPMRGMQLYKYRGKPFVFGKRVILPTYHPSYGLRDQSKLKYLETDFALLSKMYGIIEPFYYTI
jgi:uracil-DNA glycosylase